jgi:hypothetical protein
MEYYNEFHLKNLLQETVTAIKFEKKKLRYLEKELVDFENARMYLNLSEEELHGLLNLGQISFYLTRDNNVYFRKSELDYQIFFNVIPTTENFEEAGNRIMSNLMSS